MNQKFTDELISAYLDGELTADERRLVEQQLMDNLEHRKMFEELRALRNSIKSLPAHKLDDDFHLRVLKRAERVMLSGDGDDSHGDASPHQPPPAAGQAADSSPPQAAAEQAEQPAAQAELPAQNAAAAQRRRLQATWLTAALVLAGMILFGVFIYRPTHEAEVARHDANSNASPAPATTGPSADHQHAESELAGASRPGEPSESRLARSGTSKESLEFQDNAAGRSLTKRPDAERDVAVRQRDEPLSRSTDGARSSDGMADKSLPPDAEKRRMRGRAAGEALRSLKKAQTESRNVGRQGAAVLDQLAESADTGSVESDLGAPQPVTRIVQVVMSQEAYEAGVFDQALSRHHIVFEQEAAQAGQDNYRQRSMNRQRNAEPGGARTNSLGDELSEVEDLHRPGGDVDVLVVDAGPEQIDAMLSDLEQIPGEQVALSYFSAPMPGLSQGYASVNAGEAQLGAFAAEESSGLRDRSPAEGVPVDEASIDNAARNRLPLRGGGFGGAGSATPNASPPVGESAPGVSGARRFAAPPKDPATNGNAESAGNAPEAAFRKMKTAAARDGEPAKEARSESPDPEAEKAPAEKSPFPDAASPRPTAQPRALKLAEDAEASSKSADDAPVAPQASSEAAPVATTGSKGAPAAAPKQESAPAARPDSLAGALPAGQAEPAADRPLSSPSNGIPFRRGVARRLPQPELKETAEAIAGFQQQNFQERLFEDGRAENKKSVPAPGGPLEANRETLEKNGKAAAAGERSDAKPSDVTTSAAKPSPAASKRDQQPVSETPPAQAVPSDADAKETGGQPSPTDDSTSPSGAARGTARYQANAPEGDLEESATGQTLAPAPFADRQQSPTPAGGDVRVLFVIRVAPGRSAGANLSAGPAPTAAEQAAPQPAPAAPDK